MDARETARSPLLGACADSTPQDRRNARRFLWTVFAWSMLFTGISAMLKRDLIPAGAASWIAAATPSVAGVFVLLAFRRFLLQADELQRAIQLQALALGFGGGWLATSGYQVLERVGAPPADGGDYVMAMTIFYVIGLLIGRRRYR